MISVNQFSKYLSPFHIAKIICLLVALSSGARAQSGKGPSVQMAPVPLVTAQRAAQTKVSLNFRVVSGFHINSNKPKDEFLIPTQLKMDAPTDIVLSSEYPAGEDVSFPFSPDTKLNVYSGDFTINLRVHPMASVVPG